MAAQRLLSVDAEEVELPALDRVEDSRVPFAGADLADHAVGAVCAPIDRADVLAHQRARPPCHRRDVVRGRGGRAVGDPADRLHERLDRSAADLVAIQAALPDLARTEGARGPHIAGVELAVGLEHRHAPLAHPELDCPVQRRRHPVAPRTGVHDQATMPRPDRLGDQPLQHRAHDQLRAMLADRRLHRRARVDHRDRHLVTELGQRDPRPLTEAVVRRHEEENPHHTSPSCSSISERGEQPELIEWAARMGTP
jgi:hypothetical protein